MLFGDDSLVKEGDIIKRTKRINSVPVKRLDGYKSIRTTY